VGSSFFGIFGTAPARITSAGFVCGFSVGLSGFWGLSTGLAGERDLFKGSGVGCC